MIAVRERRRKRRQNAFRLTIPEQPRERGPFKVQTGLSVSREIALVYNMFGVVNNAS